MVPFISRGAHQGSLTRGLPSVSVLASPRGHLLPQSVLSGSHPPLHGPSAEPLEICPTLRQTPLKTIHLAGSKPAGVAVRELVRLVVGAPWSPVDNCLDRHPLEVTGKFHDNRASCVLVLHQLVQGRPIATIVSE